MPRPFKSMSLGDFALAVANYPWSSEKREVHVHCTDSPDHATYHEVGGLECVERMYRYHTETLGWSDIAQHITIDPDGVIWTGRSWNRTPASAVGHNEGAFMFEMIGLFDTGKDTFDGAQEATAHTVSKIVATKFGMSIDSDIRFHNEFTNLKTCPGSAIDRDNYIKHVKDLPLSSSDIFTSFSSQPSTGSSDIFRRLIIDQALKGIATNEDEGIIDDFELDHTLIEGM